MKRKSDRVEKWGGKRWGWREKGRKDKGEEKEIEKWREEKECGKRWRKGRNGWKREIGKQGRKDKVKQGTEKRKRWGRERNIDKEEGRKINPPSVYLYFIKDLAKYFLIINVKQVRLKKKKIKEKEIFIVFKRYCYFLCILNIFCIANTELSPLHFPEIYLTSYIFWNFFCIKNKTENVHIQSIKYLWRCCQKNLQNQKSYKPGIISIR